MLIPIVSLIGGLILLVIASDQLVDGAVGIAHRLGISMLVVGLTIVAYGTSFPEFIVSLLAASRGVADFAAGNIVGSNIANIGLVLGMAAAICPFVVKSSTLFRRDMPLLFLATVSAGLVFMDGQVVRWEGLSLIAIAVVFTYLSLKHPGVVEVEGGNDEDPTAEPKEAMGASTLRLLLGAVGLVGGAHLMVEGGSAIASAYGISERVIGLTVVAVGTSLPELAASVAAALKGYPELAVGNVVGSCLFNLTFVLGASAAIHPLDVDMYAMRWDLVIMAALTLL
ncbi:MAG: cation:H+ antiporter, partial [Bradymonadia bacterium]